MKTIQKNPPFPYWLFLLLFVAMGLGLWLWVSRVERQRQQAVNHCLSTQLQADPTLENNPQQLEDISSSCTTKCLQGELTGCQ
ncbi:hypothetical protein [Baaleninema sp.]|uniref:hypothetical protein n=1 Tax=Baaleninema sp. TaxID=3101197 RepID=UPI003D027205